MHDPSMADASIVIMGAGPAGLTAALELVRSGHKNVVVVEQEAQVGGISRTITHNGNRMDIGGHRFFSKSDTVMAWWNDILPLETENSTSDKVLLIRNRVSRILYLRKFFDYPISLSVKTLQNLGLARTFSIGLGYIRALLFPIRPEKTLQDFFVNRFGRKLYELFFRDYTEKVWGVPCSGISADWGAQRVKGLSILQVLRHAVRSFFSKGGELRQKET
ncbi:NAD(P)-binding protein, partial [Desulfovibrio sp. OttesenSCG-928-M14]|nr:NAD(P)-binding protein [Desulfovibrio sp. OttesenSCG-928-M14]